MLNTLYFQIQSIHSLISSLIYKIHGKRVTGMVGFGWEEQQSRCPICLFRSNDCSLVAGIPQCNGPTWKKQDGSKFQNWRPGVVSKWRFLTKLNIFLLQISLHLWDFTLMTLFCHFQGENERISGVAREGKWTDNALWKSRPIVYAQGKVLVLPNIRVVSPHAPLFAYFQSITRV